MWPITPLPTVRLASKQKGRQTDDWSRVTVPLLLLPLSQPPPTGKCAGEACHPQTPAAKLPRQLFIKVPFRTPPMSHIVYTSSPSQVTPFLICCWLYNTCFMLTAPRLPSYLHKHMNKRQNQSAQLIQQQANQTRSSGCTPSASRFRKTAFGNNRFWYVTAEKWGNFQRLDVAARAASR